MVHPGERDYGMLVFLEFSSRRTPRIVDSSKSCGSLVHVLSRSSGEREVSDD